MDMNNNDRTYRINGQDKTFAELTIDEKVQLLRESMERNAKAPRTGSFSNGTPKGGWTDADRVPAR
jgi:hypothetical protein